MYRPADALIQLYNGRSMPYGLYLYTVIDLCTNSYRMQRFMHPDAPTPNPLYSGGERLPESFVMFTNDGLRRSLYPH